MRRSLTISLLSVLALGMSLRAMGQDAPAWLYAHKEEPMTGKSYDAFILAGSYITPPTVAAARVPSIIVECAEGKFRTAGLSVGAVVAALPFQPGFSAPNEVNVDQRLDENKPSTGQWKRSSDFKTLTFDEFSPTKLLTGLQLWGSGGKLWAVPANRTFVKRVRLSVEEVSAGPVIMQFDMPRDSTQLIQSCGLIGKLRGN
jgi:hypothetical protein